VTRSGRASRCPDHLSCSGKPGAPAGVDDDGRQHEHQRIGLLWADCSGPQTELKTAVQKALSTIRAWCSRWPSIKACLGILTTPQHSVKGSARAPTGAAWLRGLLIQQQEHQSAPGDTQTLISAQVWLCPHYVSPLPKVAVLPLLLFCWLNGSAQWQQGLTLLMPLRLVISEISLDPADSALASLQAIDFIECCLSAHSKRMPACMLLLLSEIGVTRAFGLQPDSVVYTFHGCRPCTDQRASPCTVPS
jgi:hypothetical protein